MSTDVQKCGSKHPKHQGVECHLQNGHNGEHLSGLYGIPDSEDYIKFRWSDD